MNTVKEEHKVIFNCIWCQQECYRYDDEFDPEDPTHWRVSCHKDFWGSEQVKATYTVVTKKGKKNKRK